MFFEITKQISAFSIPVMIIIIILYGAYKKINVYEAFTLGAKDGIENTFSIIPPLVGLMVAISAFRASGTLEQLEKLTAPLLGFLKIPKELLPLALLRPVSGSGSLAIVADIFKNHGTDSFLGRCASVMMGSTETTFYTLSVYFGAVQVKNTRHTAKAALTADLFSVFISVFVAHLFFNS